MNKKTIDVKVSSGLNGDYLGKSKELNHYLTFNILQQVAKFVFFVKNFTMMLIFMLIKYVLRFND